MSRIGARADVRSLLREILVEGGRAVGPGRLESLVAQVTTIPFRGRGEEGGMEQLRRRTLHVRSAELSS